jgi:hypothetical protein
MLKIRGLGRREFGLDGTWAAGMSDTIYCGCGTWPGLARVLAAPVAVRLAQCGVALCRAWMGSGPPGRPIRYIAGAGLGLGRRGFSRHPWRCGWHSAASRCAGLGWDLGRRDVRYDILRVRGLAWVGAGSRGTCGGATGTARCRVVPESDLQS